MSILKFNKTSGLVEVSHGGKSYTFDKAGELKDAAGKLVPDADKKALSEAIVLEVETQKGNLSKGTREAVEGALGEFGKNGVDADRVKNLTKNFESVKKIEAAAVAKDHNAIAKELLKNPDAREFVGTEGNTALRNAGFQMHKLDEFSLAKDELHKIMGSEKFDEEALRKHLISNEEHMAHFKASDKHLNEIYNKTGKNLEFDKIKSEITTKIDETHGKLKSAAQDVDKNLKTVKNLTDSKAGPKKLEAAQKALTEAETKFKEIAGDKEFGSAALNKLHRTDKDLVEGISKSSKNLEGTIKGALKNEGGIAAAAGKGAKLVDKLFKHTSGDKIGKVHWGKAALWTAGAVVAYKVVAGIGNKGKAADMNQQRGQEQLEAQRA